MVFLALLHRFGKSESEIGGDGLFLALLLVYWQVLLLLFLHLLPLLQLPAFYGPALVFGQYSLAYQK